MLAASAAAEAALLPVGAFVFSRVTFAGLVLNFAAIPLMARRADRRHGRRAGVAGLADCSRRLSGGSRTSAPKGWCARRTWSTWRRSLTWRVAPPHWIAVVVYYAG